MFPKLTPKDLPGLYIPPKNSHKGQNGKLLVIGGSKLFHASIFWAADVASRIVDLVHFSSPAMENNDLVRQKAKTGFWNGIVVPWEEIDTYVKEDDCILIGPGLPRPEGLKRGETSTSDIVNPLFEKYPKKRWVIDGGALQEMNNSLLTESMIITPHAGEFHRLFNFETTPEKAQKMAQKFYCTILLKSVEDTICSKDYCVRVAGGNPGMTKGGTGDVLAGLVAALYCKNPAFLAAQAGSLINKTAGDNLYQKVGPYFNASDLLQEIPFVLKELTAR
ncbi:NAD(P)H-hydrate dehydratase [Microgenomates group bacterium RIFCSPLOWO2_01_FULL_46_13]|nr:MAG: NAD(P)H-hydrate dehydratase [Microgenomates group bacterium RIFCSPHIGHO2_01_FULL_45_11]OGV95033.1 MAG: NAD(P)H-hydrate dehydratase [Microgenomates group bacterium RIFCSPLOWO2_01_FULL_46_13]